MAFFIVDNSGFIPRILSLFSFAVSDLKKTIQGGYGFYGWFVVPQYFLTAWIGSDHRWSLSIFCYI